MANTPEREVQESIPTKTLVDVYGCEQLVDKEELTDTLEMINNNLHPGVPVFIETFEATTKRIVRDAIVFLSDGSIDQYGRFGIMSGKYGSRSTISTQDEQIITNSSANITNKSLTIPHVTGGHATFNEGTFSPNGGYISGYTDRKTVGCSKIIIGEGVTETYPKAVGSAEFVRDSVSFRTPHFYSANRVNVISSDTPKILSAEAEALKWQIRKQESLAFVSAMMTAAVTELDDKSNKPGKMPFQGHLILREAVTYLEKDAGFVNEDGHLILPTDYVVYEGCYPDRRVGYLKLDAMANGFFLPCKGFKNAAKLAFSEEFVKQFYPKS